MSNFLNEFFEKMSKFFTTTSIRSVIALITVLSCFVLIIMMIYHPVPEPNQRLVDMAFGGVLTLGLGSVYNYLYGSSKNESDRAKKNLEE